MIERSIWLLKKEPDQSQIEYPEGMAGILLSQYLKSHTTTSPFPLVSIRKIQPVKILYEHVDLEKKISLGEYLSPKLQSSHIWTIHLKF